MASVSRRRFFCNLPSLRPCQVRIREDLETPRYRAAVSLLGAVLRLTRIAFSLPVVNEPAPSSEASWRRCGFPSAPGFSFAGLGGRRPRRLASVVTAASSASISTSSNRFSAPPRSFGKKWRCCEVRPSGPALPFGTAEGPAAFTVGRAENRSGVVSAGRRVGMPPTMPPVAHRGNSWQGLDTALRPDDARRCGRVRGGHYGDTGEGHHPKRPRISR